MSKSPAKRNWTNITETDSNYKLQMAVPGYRKEELSITIEENRLSITADRHETTGDIKYQEWHQSAINRSWTLGKGVDAEQIEAQLENGILTVTIAKLAEAKPKLIHIA